jgi:hypothetical protein
MTATNPDDIGPDGRVRLPRFPRVRRGLPQSATPAPPARSDVHEAVLARTRGARHEPPGWFWVAIILGSGLLMGVLQLLPPPPN